MSFNLYFAGSQCKEVEEHLIKKQCNRLCSQIGERNLITQYSELLPEVKPTLFVDSGAFSVAHAGKTVNIDDYIQYINNNACVNYWAELDVIPYPVLNQQTALECSEKSWENYLYMLPRVNCPQKILPLYHYGEPKDHLRRILDTPVYNSKPAEYIGIGGRHGVSTDLQKVYFDNIFDIIAKSNNPKVKVHAFGLTVLNLLEKFPFYSADSTTWLQIGVNGGILTKYGIFSVSANTQFRKESLHQANPDVKKEVIKEIESYGYNLEELSKNYKKRLMFNIDYFKNWADNYTYKPEKYKKRSLI
jgi:hypothetical protein